MKQTPRGHRAGRLSGFCTGGGRRMRPPPAAVPEGMLGFYVCRRAKPAASFCGAMPVFVRERYARRFPLHTLLAAPAVIYSSPPQGCCNGERAGRPRSAARVFCPVRGAYACSSLTQAPVTASWNIIQYPLPLRSNTERGRYEHHLRSGSGGSPRRSDGTP